MAINKNEIFKTVPVKGKKGQNIQVCNYDNKIIIQPNDKSNVANEKTNACYDKKPRPVTNVSVGIQTLQAPDNDWMVIEDSDYYKVPDSQKGVPVKQKDKALGRISRVRANLVFVKYQGTLRKMLKMDKNAPYNYIDAEKAIPYYQYILKNEGKYGVSPEQITWAKGVEKKIKEVSVSFDGNTDLDLGFDGESDFTSNTNLDLSFDGNTSLDLSFDGDSSSADGSKKFRVVKPQAKVFAQDKSTGVIHFTKRKLGKGSKVSGTILPKGNFKFRKKDKKTKAISVITKSAGFIKIGENNKANMLVHIGAVRPIIKKRLAIKKSTSSLDGNTTLDLSFDGNTNIDLSVQGGRVSRPRRKHPRRRNRRYVNRGRNRSLKKGIKKSSLDGNTNLDLGFDGNTNLDLGSDGSRNRPAMDVTLNNLDLGFDANNNINWDLGFNGSRRPELDITQNMDLGADGESDFTSNTNLDLGADGESDFTSNTNLDLGFNGSRRPALDVNQNMDLGADGFSRMQRREMKVNTNRRLNDNLSFNGGALEEDYHGGGDMLAFDGSEEMSNAFGDWAKGVFSKEKRAENKANKKSKALTKEQAAILADKNKVVYTEDEMKAVYESSGSTKPFSEWTKSEGAKNLMNSIAQFGAAFLQAKSKQAAGETSTEGEGDISRGGDSPKGEKTILGMHPINFAIVATAVGLTVIGIIWYVNKGKGAAKLIPAT